VQFSRLNAFFIKQCFEFSVFRVGGISHGGLPYCDIMYYVCDMIRKAEVLIWIYIFTLLNM
jgi:hypothetical protein